MSLYALREGRGKISLFGRKVNRTDRRPAASVIPILCVISGRQENAMFIIQQVKSRRALNSFYFRVPIKLVAEVAIGGCSRNYYFGIDGS